MKAESPLRNGGPSPQPPSRLPTPSPPRSPLEEPRDYGECFCDSEPTDFCSAAVRDEVRPRHVHALHHALLPGVNGTRAPVYPHRFAVRPAEDPEREGLFASVVPLYKYSDYADDYCAKNLSQVPLCAHLPWTEFAPPPPDPPPPPSPPPLRPYPVDEPKETPDDDEEESVDVKLEIKREPEMKEEIEVEAEMVGVPTLEPSERLKAPLLTPEDETQFGASQRGGPLAARHFATEPPQHRTVARTKAEPGGGAALVAACRAAAAAAPAGYAQLLPAPQLARPALAADAALAAALRADGPRDPLGRPARPQRFAEWHECASLGSLVALPYVVID